MLSSLTLDDQTGSPVTLHETANRSVVQATGLVGLSAPRRNARTRPTAHGSIDDTRYLDEAAISVVGDTYGATQVVAYSEMELITAPMLATLTGNASLMKWFPGGITPFINEVTNPSFELNVAGYGATGWGGGAPTRTNAYASSGAWSIQMTTTVMAAGGQNSLQVLGPLTIGAAANAWSFGAGRAVSAAAVFNLTSRTGNGQVYVQVNFINAAGAFISAAIGNPLTALTAGRSVLNGAIAPAGTAGILMFLVANEGTPNPPTSQITSYADAVQMHRDVAVCPTYADGDFTGYGWTGTPGASPSVILGGRQRLVKLAGPVLPPLAEAAAILRYQASFAAADPLAYEQALTTATGATITGGGALGITNTGKAPTRQVVIVINAVGATLTNPVVTLAGSQKITLVGTIAAGHQISINLDTKAVLLDGVTNSASIVDSANTQWFSLPPGTSALTLTGTGANSSFLTASARSAFTV